MVQPKQRHCFQHFSSRSGNHLILRPGLLDTERAVTSDDSNLDDKFLFKSPPE